MRKDYSLHRKGMKIAVFSELLFHKHGKDWHRGGTNIEYSANNIGEFNGLHTLGWDYNLESTESWVYFAYAYPYTYTQLREQLTTGLLRDNKKKGEVEIKKLGLTLMKNIIYLIHIKEKNDTKDNAEETYTSKEL